MTTGYKNRKKKNTAIQRRKAGDARDAVSPTILKKRELTEQREVRQLARLEVETARRKKAEKMLEKAKKVAAKKVAAKKKASTKKATTKKTADKKAVTKKKVAKAE